MNIPLASSSTSNSGASPVPMDTSASRIPTQSLGQDDFLKLLVTQMTSQDPMNPQTDADFIAQMAQFSSLQSMNTLGTEVSRLNSQQQFTQAASLLGRSVRVQTGQTTSDQGVVTAVHVNAGAPQLLINGQAYDLSQVLSVEPVPTGTH